MPKFLQQLLCIPAYLLADTYRRSNGFFGYEDEYNDDGTTRSHRSWYRSSVKVVMPSLQKPAYIWHEMTFFSCWTPDQSYIVGVGIPKLFARLFQNILSQAPHVSVYRQTPYSMYIPIIEALVAMYDLSVWRIRDAVRNVEHNRQRVNQSEDLLRALHEISRHAIHASETLQVSIDGLESMQQQARCFETKCSKSQKNVLDNQDVEARLDFHTLVLRALLLRSKSNKERLENEISLAYNLIAQHDNRAMAILSQAAVSDSSAMRTIALVTLAFLPATFVSHELLQFYPWDRWDTGQVVNIGGVLDLLGHSYPTHGDHNAFMVLKS